MEQLYLGFDSSDTTAVTFSSSLSAAVDELSSVSEGDARGAVFTRAEVVDFILDLVGYTEEQPLYEKRLLEPSFGGGAFLLKVVQRLLAAWKRFRNSSPTLEELGESIRAVELHGETYRDTRRETIRLLEREGMKPSEAESLVDRWLSQGDFLLAPLYGRFDFVVGNPPYVRQEMIPTPLLSEYRRRYRTIFDRADLYIPFIERSLSLLAEGGVLGFICSDRWMKNRYGGPLRNLVASEFRLKIYVDMTDVRAFHSDVSAYPAITVIGREPPGTTRIAYRPEIDRKTLTSLASEFRSLKLQKNPDSVREIDGVTSGEAPWLLEPSDWTKLVRRLEENFPSLEETGCSVGIGVATGADKAFIGEYDALDVEPDRKLPLVTTKDIVSGEVHWLGRGIVNPFADGGGLVDLNVYPRLRRYLEDRRDVIARRHCAQKTPKNWYRTIDRIKPSLASRPKLLVPDIKGEAHIVYERGKLYPHHNLYYVTSDEWDLRALQAILLSAISRLFVAIYSTRMRGGYLRFQAQYLRRIRIPRWSDVSEVSRKQLAEAAVARDIDACNNAAFRLYGLNGKDRAALGGNSTK